MSNFRLFTAGNFATEGRQGKREQKRLSRDVLNLQQNTAEGEQRGERSGASRGT
jgi:hypothetical protein